MPNEIEENEEIDVTELIERIEKLEKENIIKTEEIKKLDGRIIDCEDTIDALSAKLEGGE